MSRFARTFGFTALGFAAFAAAGCSASTSPAGEQSGALENTAVPTPLSGDFRFAGTVIPLGRLTVDVVDDRMSDAAARLEALRAIGAACRYVAANTTRCTKMYPASDVPQRSLDTIAAENRRLVATFGETTGSPSITSQGDLLTEWKIPQRGSSPLGSFEDYLYRDLGNGLVKIVLPGASDSIEFIVRDATHLARWAGTSETESRWRFHQDGALVILQR